MSYRIHCFGKKKKNQMQTSRLAGSTATKSGGVETVIVPVLTLSGRKHVLCNGSAGRWPRDCIGVAFSPENDTYDFEMEL